MGDVSVCIANLLCALVTRKGQFLGKDDLVVGIVARANQQKDGRRLNGLIRKSASDSNGHRSGREFYCAESFSCFVTGGEILGFWEGHHGGIGSEGRLRL